MRISNRQARHVILHLQGLCDDPLRKQTQSQLYGLIKRLGFVQLDSILWVERAHHMTLFARNQTYRPPQLAKMLERDRLLFEGWTHDASVIPSRFYRYWRHRHRRKREKLAAKFTQWQGEGYADHCDILLDRIAEFGPLRARDLERPKGEKQPMWQWHDGKAALEYLWLTGSLAISRREGFQKVYDLAQNCIGAEDFNARVSEEEFIDWACRSALERLGFATPGDIARYFDLVSIEEAKNWVEKGGGNTVSSVDVETVDGGRRAMVARADIASLLDEICEAPQRLRVLSPFDPVIRDRKRLEWLFGFDYRIEIYVPAEMRIWGYYIFPLLEDDRLIGRIDMRADRKADCLRVRRLWLEAKVKFGSDRRKRLEGELARQARLCGMSNICWDDDALSDVA